MGVNFWAPSAAASGPLRELQQMQLKFLRQACQLSNKLPAAIGFKELQLTRAGGISGGGRCPDFARLWPWLTLTQFTTGSSVTL